MNEHIQGEALIPIIDDDDFERGNVPMTKASVRHLSIAKLELAKDSVLYDIGSGTGSIAVQAALLDNSIKVYAVEKKAEAVELIEKNKKKFFCDNIEIVKGEAPEALTGLMLPTHAFIGGSSGNLNSILDMLKKMSPGIRIVLNAVSLETISELMSIIKTFELENLSLEQVAISKVRELGNYHMMSAENPVLIAAFNLR